jgi:hypothetical protein
MFLYDDVSPWGQGATVIHPHRGAVQKPPAVHTHCATAQPAASQGKKTNNGGKVDAMASRVLLYTNHEEHSRR